MPLNSKIKINKLISNLIKKNKNKVSLSFILNHDYLFLFNSLNSLSTFSSCTLKSESSPTSKTCSLSKWAAVVKIASISKKSSKVSHLQLSRFCGIVSSKIRNNNSCSGLQKEKRFLAIFISGRVFSNDSRMSKISFKISSSSSSFPVVSNASASGVKEDFKSFKMVKSDPSR